MTQKPDKRIVSKGEYVTALGSKGSLALLGTGVIVIASFCLLVTCIGTFALLIQLEFGLLLALITIVGGLSLFLLIAGVRMVKEAKEIDAGIPLTRANTGDLPAPESLVRASQEPVQEQQAILLRAAGEEPKAQAEQLLRATTGE